MSRRRSQIDSLVSVIIPVYNVKLYLREALESVINQTYRNLEIIIVDDGSTDGSGEVCDEYQSDRRIKVFHTNNRGLSAARNYALDRIHGDFIAFLDSDDWLELNAIERFVSLALNTNADIVVCSFYQEYKDKTVEPVGYETEFVVEGEEILQSMIIERKLTEDVWNKFYKANIFGSIRYPEGRIFEDKATTYRLLQIAGKLVYTPAPLIHYRNRRGSLSNIHSMKSLVDYWLVYRERFDTLGGLSDQYYKVALSETINAISRMWRWYAGCTAQEKKQGKVTLDEMQHFIEEHRREITKGPYSKHVKTTCYYARTTNSFILRLLYLANKIYSNKNLNVYFEE